MGSSPGFGSAACHHRPFRLAFAPAPGLHPVNPATRNNSPAHSSISTRSPRSRGALTACRRTVSGSFHPPPGVLFTFPSRYSFTIGRQEYLALEGGPPSFPRDCTGPAVLKRRPRRGARFAYGAVTRSGPGFHRVRLRAPATARRSWAAPAGLPTPPPQRPRPWHGGGLGSSRFAHHYSGNLG